MGGGGIPGEKIPLLTDLLVLAEESGLHLNLELKTELTDSDHAIAGCVKPPQQYLKCRISGRADSVFRL